MAFNNTRVLPGKRLRADLILLSVSVIWGFAFVVQRVAANQTGVFLFTGLRFLLGAFVLLPFAWIDRKRSNSRQLTQTDSTPWIILAGILLMGGAAFQQAGLRYTTAGNAGFITGLYVVLIPIFLAIGWRKRITTKIWIAACLSASGLFLLSTGGQLRINLGDSLILAGAVLWALHVILIGWLVTRLDILTLSIGQYLVCGLLGLGLGLILETRYLSGLEVAIWAIAYTGAISVGMGYTLQAVGQKVAPPTDAAVILSSEAVFAATFGWLFLSESLSAWQLFGCALIMTGVLVSQGQLFRH